MPYDLTSPVSARELAQLDDRLDFLQFSAALSEADYRLLAEWIRDKPHTTLRAYGSYDGSIADLDFLRWLPTLKRFRVDVFRLDDIQGLMHLPDGLVSLGLGATKKRMSLRPLERFGDLRHLFLENHTKDIDVIGGLTQLVDLVLRSITLDDLGLLQSMERLEALDLKLGGTTNLDALPTIGRIRYLELWQIRGLTELGPVAAMPHLEYVFLQSLRRVERLPDFSGARALRFLWLETMKGLTDLSPLATAPSLEHVALIDMGHLAPEALVPLTTCRALKSARATLGSSRKDRQAEEILGPLSTDRWDIWDRKGYRMR